jgi:carbon monoxide dehydrogenase subunit G
MRDRINARTSHFGSSGPGWAVLMTGLILALVLLAPSVGRAQGQSAREPLLTVDADKTPARISASIRIDAPPERLWRVMLDCKRSTKIVAGMERCAVLSQDPAGRWDVRVHVVNRSAFLPTVRSEFRSDYQPFTHIKFKRTAGDLKSLQGEWRLTALDGGKATRLDYAVAIDPGVPLPVFVLRPALEADARAVLKALQREAESSRE